MNYRIALIGNMNNNFFAITRYLRDMGYDAHLFYRIGMDHFQPQADTYTAEYKSYCHKVDWLDKGFHNIDEDVIICALSGFDFYIGQGDEAAAAYRAGFNMDVYYPYGSDVYKYSYLPQHYTFWQKSKAYAGLNKDISYRQMRRGTAAKYMRGVIVNAKNILAEYTNEDFELKLRGLQCKGKYQYVPMPFIYYKEYINSNNPVCVSWKDTVQAIRESNDLVILYHGRQEWKTVHNEFTGKNTHYLIEGFAEFVKSNPLKRIHLIMVEYGTDVNVSKLLIEQLGIKACVTWLPKMYRKDIMYLLKYVDLCAGEFGRSYLTYGTVVEAMLMKKPVMHHRNDILYSSIYKELYPMIHAASPSEVVKGLQYAIDNRDLISTMGEKAQAWIITHFITNPLLHLQKLIEEKRKANVPDGNVSNYTAF